MLAWESSGRGAVLFFVRARCKAVTATAAGWLPCRMTRGPRLWLGGEQQASELPGRI